MVVRVCTVVCCAVCFAVLFHVVLFVLFVLCGLCASAVLPVVCVCGCVCATGCDILVAKRPVAELPIDFIEESAALEAKPDTQVCASVCQ